MLLTIWRATSPSQKSREPQHIGTVLNGVGPYLRRLPERMSRMSRAKIWPEVVGVSGTPFRYTGGPDAIRPLRPCQGACPHRAICSGMVKCDLFLMQDIPHPRYIEMAQLAEAAGCENVWVIDGQDVFP